MIFSSPRAIGADHHVVALPPALPATVAGGASPVQMWRTIPWRDKRRRDERRDGPDPSLVPFQRAEFTALAGVNHAIQKAEHLIWIFDQYFWSVPLARQLN